jgi:hypothetical protein
LEGSGEYSDGPRGQNKRAKQLEGQEGLRMAKRAAKLRKPKKNPLGEEEGAESFHGNQKVLTPSMACRKMLTEHSIVPGLSWGTLPLRLQAEYVSGTADTS